MEQRIVIPSKVEIRADGDKKRLVGLVKVNVKSVDLGGFREMLMPGAFDDIMDNDVRVLKKHNPDLILGRTKSGTARMKIDDAGNLEYESDLPNTTVGKDIEEEVNRGDIDATSFAFRVNPESVKWIEEEDGTILRQVGKLMLLRDLSPVVYPAYPDNGISLRSEYDAWKEAQRQDDEGEEQTGPDDDLGTKKRHLRSIEIEMNGL